MKASVIIPTKDKISRLSLVVKALDPQVTNEVEVIIVFDGCSQKTIDAFNALSLRFKPKMIILPENKGRSVARNKGLHAAKGELIIFIDDDRIPEENFIKLHLEAHQEKDLVVLGCRTDVDLEEEYIQNIYQSDKSKSSYNLEPIYQTLRKIAREEDLKQLGFIRHIHFLRWMLFYTGNVSVKKKLIFEAGLFDENFVRWGSEDVDLGIRLYLNGIPFVHRNDIINYHILHERSFTQRLEDNLQTHTYLTKKYRKNISIYLILLAKKLRFKYLPDYKRLKEY